MMTCVGIAGTTLQDTESASITSVAPPVSSARPTAGLDAIYTTAQLNSQFWRLVFYKISSDGSLKCSWHNSSLC